jgi:hypothetical protein
MKDDNTMLYVLGAGVFAAIAYFIWSSSQTAAKAATAAAPTTATILANQATALSSALTGS